MIPMRSIPLSGLLPLAIAALGSCERPEPLPQTPPRQVSPSPFQYPEELWDAAVTGETLLRIHISGEGSVDTVRVERTSGHAAFDSAAASGARELRFDPATKGGAAVPVWRLLPVQFHPDSAGTS